MDHDEIETPKCYALIFSSYEYGELQTALAEQGIVEADERIVRLLQEAEAAVFVGKLTDRQRTLFETKVRKHSWYVVAVVPIFLIPDHAKWVLHELLNDNTRWDDQRDRIAKIAKEVRERKYRLSEIEKLTTDDTTLAVLKQKYESQIRHEHESWIKRKSETPIEPLPLESIEPDPLEPDCWHSHAFLHEVSATQHNWAGWTAIAVARYKVLHGREPNKREKEKEARNVQNWIEGYRKAHNLTPPDKPPS